MRKFSIRKLAKESSAKEVVETIEKLAERDGLKEWSKTLNYTLPPFQKPPKAKDSLNWLIFFKTQVLHFTNEMMP